MKYTEIELAKNHKSLKAGFKWADIPDLAVITGLNGSGKTHLLETLENPNEFYPSNAELGIFIQFLRSKADISAQFLSATDNKNLKERRQGIIRQILQNYDDKIKFKNLLSNYKSNPNQYLPTETIRIIKILEQKLNKEGITNLNKTFYEFERQLIIEELNKIPIIEKTNNMIGGHLSQIIFNYFFYLKNAQSEYCYLENSGKHELINSYLIEKIGYCENPIKKINAELAGLHFRIKSYNQDDYDYVTKFYNIGNPDIEYGFESLSTGEQAIIHILSVWLNSLSNKDDNVGGIIIIDEFDAHLNPSLAQLLVKIIREVLIGKLKNQVFLTTHSPSTCAWIPEENLFWMESGKLLHEPNNRKSKIEILNLLSKSQQIEFNPVLHIITDPLKPYFIFCEGYADVKALSKICLKLGGDYKREIYDKVNFLTLDGTTNFNLTIMKNFVGKTNKKINKTICLFDYDANGFKCFNEFKHKKVNEFIAKANDNLIATIIEPEQNTAFKFYAEHGYFPIELCYPEKIFNNYFNAKNLEYLNIGDRNELNEQYFIEGHCKNDHKQYLDNDKYFIIRNNYANEESKLKILNEIDSFNEAQLIGFVPTLNNLLKIINEFSNPKN